MDNWSFCGPFALCGSRNKEIFTLYQLGEYRNLARYLKNEFVYYKDILYRIFPHIIFISLVFYPEILIRKPIRRSKNLWIHPKFRYGNLITSL